MAQHVHAEAEVDEFHDAADQSPEKRINSTVPLTAIPVTEIAMLYPTAKLRRRAQRVSNGDRPVPRSEVPAFLDFNHKSPVLKVLRTRLW